MPAITAIILDIQLKMGHLCLCVYQPEMNILLWVQYAHISHLTYLSGDAASHSTGNKPKYIQCFFTCTSPKLIFFYPIFVQLIMVPGAIFFLTSIIIGLWGGGDLLPYVIATQHVVWRTTSSASNGHSLEVQNIWSHPSQQNQDLHFS